MKIMRKIVEENERGEELFECLNRPGFRLGLITSKDGRQLETLVLNTVANKLELWETPLAGTTYESVTNVAAQAHWMERTTWDMFGLRPLRHPRLKNTLLHESFKKDFFPLQPDAEESETEVNRHYELMKVEGEGVFELPVGPIHAGIIEPGHFHFSCLGEVIFNLEIRLGYVHRGIEKRLIEVPLSKQRFVAEAAASDSAVAYATAHAVAVENLLDVEPPERSQILRTIALEIERSGMHLFDLSGIAADLGFVAVSAALARLRGDCLRMAELLSGSRLLRGFVCPGGVTKALELHFGEVQRIANFLQHKIQGPLQSLLSNQVAVDRMDKIGQVKRSLATDFGFNGITGRASGGTYDVRNHYCHGLYPKLDLQMHTESAGDILARTKVRANELQTSLKLIVQLLDTRTSGKFLTRVPSDNEMPSDAVGASVVESHRGELIHLIMTGRSGKLLRYSIKDPSVNNWTALAIASRNNLISDFPLCNKSFALSYGGHDL